MLSAVWSRLVRVRVTVLYTVVLSAVMVTLVALGPKVRDKVIRYASTNLHNLGHGRIGTLLGSAFVADTDLVYLWLPGLVCLLAAAELLWHGRRLLVVFVAGHIGATIVVAVGLAAEVDLGWLPRSISRVTDVGVSYGVMAVVGALTSAVPRRFRPVWFGWWLPAAAAVVVVSTDFTDSGHVVALVLGMLMSARLDPPAVWTRTKATLVVLGVVFGYIVLVHTEELLVAATPAAAAGAAITGLVMRRRRAQSSAG